MREKAATALKITAQDLIRFGVASGRLLPGEQLPTVRALAVELATKRVKATISDAEAVPPGAKLFVGITPLPERFAGRGLS